MHLFDYGAIDLAASDIRLICHDDQSKPGILHRRKRLACSFVKAEIGEPVRREGAAVPELRNREDAITVEKDGASAVLAHHLVLRVCNIGWLTRQCQTTACIPSDRGVTRSGSTGGITMTTSP